MHKDKDKKDENEDTGAKAAEEALAKMNDVMAGLPDLIAKGLEGGFKTIVADNKKANKEANDDVDRNKDVDLEKMDRKELIEHSTSNILKEVKSQFDTITKDLKEEISATSKIVQTNSLTDQLAKARSKFSDLDEYQDEIGDQAKLHPGLSVENLYHLAKANNPDKVGELNEIMKKEKEKEEKEKAPKFGGLTPTSSLEKSDSGKMDKKEAGEDAWEKTMGGVDPAIIGGSNN